ncbi:MAG: hypothetical protein ACKOFI_01075, partial [Phycisphaerales bacterium]
MPSATSSARIPSGRRARTASAAEPKRRSIRSIGTLATMKIAEKSAAMVTANTAIPRKGWVSATSIRSTSASPADSGGGPATARATPSAHAASAAGEASAAGSFCSRATSASLPKGSVVTVSSATSSAGIPSPVRPLTGTTGQPRRRVHACRRESSPSSWPTASWRG